MLRSHHYSVLRIAYGSARRSRRAARPLTTPTVEALPAVVVQVHVRLAQTHVIMNPVLLDRHQRPLRNLRLSVTDRCNLRCSYCMPELDYVWLPREDILHFEEVETLVDVFTALGVDKVRLTGGEPLLRRDLPDLV